MKKNLLFLALFASFIYCLPVYSNNSNTLDAREIFPVIETIENQSESGIAFESTGEKAVKITVPARSRAKIKPLAIPYSSLKEHLFDFTLNKPYCPEQTLKILTKSEKFCIWQDQRGIIVTSLSELPDLSELPEVPTVLLPLDKNKLSYLASFILAVKNNGQITLQQR